MEGYKELVDKLNGLVKSLENGELSMEEVSTLEDVTRKLHERSIILRYKAFETSVLDASASDEIVSEEEAVVSEPAQDPSPEIEPTEPTESVQEPQEEEPTFDFAIFDEEPEEVSTPEMSVMDFSTPEPESANEEVVAPEPTEVAEKEIPASEPVSEEVEVPTIPSIEAEPEVTAEEKAVEIETEVVEAEIQDTKETPVAETEPVPSVSGASFLDKFAQQDNSLAGRFSAGPLDSLIGAFGLNERLRFINDLFDGSSEKFSDAIKALDAQSGLDAAREKVAGYAEENDWDPEEEVVAEFMNYLNRRYA